MARGGKREGAGRPVGSTQEIVRKNRTLKAYDEEWELISQFAKLVKHGHQKECESFIKNFC